MLPASSTNSLDLDISISLCIGGREITLKAYWSPRAFEATRFGNLMVKPQTHNDTKHNICISR